jgi:transglutaminase-like putative cysteine protease
MSSRERLTLAAALSVILGAAALVPVYADMHWAPQALGAVGSVALAGFLARRANLPGVVQPLLTTAALGAYTCLAFARETLAWGLAPTHETWTRLHELFQTGLTDIDRLAPPVPSSAGLTLIAMLGLGGVAVVVDLIAVVLSRAAVAGLPLLVLFAVPSAVLPGGLGWFPFLIGAVGWLVLLRVEGGDRVGRWGTPMRATRSERRDETSLGRVGRRIGAAALGVAIVVPAILPGLDARLIGGGGGSGSGPGSGSRSTTTYNPITKLRDDLRLQKERQILLYTTTAANPDYLRMTTLDLFSDAGWQSSKLSGNAKSNGVKGVLPRPAGLTTAVDPVTTKIHITNLNAQWLPSPAVPSRVEVDGTWLYDGPSETVYSIRSGTKKLKKIYRVTSLHVAPSRDELLQAPFTQQLPSAVAPYAANPGTEVTDFVRRLTEQITASATSPYGRVAALQAYFTDPKENFRYSVSPTVDGINSASALEDFLKGKQGFCEQYASAMAAMIRIAGVPARVAVGFTAGTKQKNGGYRVTTKDAHAWPEAWFAGAGWVRFEPTPRGDGQTNVPAYAQPSTDGTANGNTGPSAAPSAGASASPSANALSPLNGRPEDDLTGALGATQKPTGSRLAALWLPGLIALLLLVFVPRVLHVARRRRRWRRATPLVAWQQLRDDTTDLGHRWRPIDSPRAAAAQLAQRHRFDAEGQAALDRLAAHAERARYARDGAAGIAAVADLRADTRRVRAAVGAGVPRTARWRAWLLPASTLRWASSGLGTLMADGLDRFDDAWAAVGQRLRPRRYREV